MYQFSQSREGRYRRRGRSGLASVNLVTVSAPLFRTQFKRRVLQEETMKKLVFALFAAVVSMASPVFAVNINAVLVAQAVPAQIDINRAKAEELMTLKGIGDARAKAIIKGRPYARKDELVQKKIIPQSVYDEIKDKIIAKQ